MGEVDQIGSCELVEDAISSHAPVVSWGISPSMVVCNQEG